MDDKSNNAFIKQPKDKNVSITVCGRTYLISAHFSMNDMEVYFHSLENGDGAKSALAKVVHKKLQKCVPPIPTVDEVCTETDASFTAYITAVVDANHDLKTFFDNTESSLPLTERFARAITQYWDEYKSKITKTLQPTLKLVEQINKSVDFSWINKMQQVFNQYQPMINGVTQMVSEFAHRTAEIMAPIQNTISQFSSTFSKILANIQIPTFSDERKQELEASYRAWGTMGWSVLPHAPMGSFNEAPTNIKEADKIALQYFNRAGIESLFEELQIKSIKKEDLNSAMYCFEQKQYKACSLLLFGIMDSKLIRLQPRAQDKNRRKVGNKAVLKLEEKFKEKADTEYFLFHILYYSGLIECLHTFFADGNDFRKEPMVINRNFIDHGMNRRSVRRKDCIKLFLALNNLLELLDDIS